MLFYSGVLALVALTAAVGVGIVATDRIVMTPGHRVVAQAMHRAVSFAALAFLATHIVLEILAHRSHVIDAFVPFLAQGRTFYIGLGTIASDLVVLLVVTGIARGRFADGAAVDVARHPRHRLRGLAAVDRARPARGPDGETLRGLELRSMPGGGRSRPGHPVRGHHPQPPGESPASVARLRLVERSRRRCLP